MFSAATLTEVRICIRADVSPQVGTGHIMRCLALALAAKERAISVQFIARLGVPWVREQLAREDIMLAEVSGDVPAWEQPEVLLAQLANAGEPHATQEWVVLDGYHFGLDCQQAVRAAGYKLLVIDDYAHLPEYSCDILLNQNIGAKELVYKGDIGQKLLGPQYVLLRPDFFAARKSAEKRRIPPKAQNILLTLGGGDFSAHLPRMVPDFTLPELAGCILRVIAGAVPPEHIRALLRNCPADVKILNRVEDMPALLLDTDLCITAGGSTCWELCCLGVPFLALEVAENQRYAVRELSRRNVASLFTAENMKTMLRSVSARKRTQQAGFDLVKGTGTLSCLFHLCGPVFFLRAAEEADSEFIWRLASEPEVRAASGNSEPIAWKHHQDWFQSRLRDTMPFFVPCDHEAKPMGYVRFTESGTGMATVSIAVSQELRGKGLGGPLLKAACRKFWQYFPQYRLDAVVLLKNTASLKIFLAADFETKGTIVIDNREFMCFSVPARGGI